MQRPLAKVLLHLRRELAQAIVAPLEPRTSLLLAHARQEGRTTKRGGSFVSVICKH